MCLGKALPIKKAMKFGTQVNKVNEPSNFSGPESFPVAPKNGALKKS
jgi:hypothetical protein